MAEQPQPLLAVADEQALAATRRLMREESLLLGPASGAAVHAAIELATREAPAGGTIVAILPDAAERTVEHWMQEPNR